MGIRGHRVTTFTADASRRVTIRWTCHHCGHINTADQDLTASGSAYPEETDDKHRTVAYAGQNVRSNLTGFLVRLRRRQDSFEAYRPMHLCCACEKCGCREPWAVRRPRRPHKVRSVGDPLYTFLPCIVLIMLVYCAVCLVIVRSAAALLIPVIAAAAAGLVYMACRIRRDRQIRALPDSAFPVLVDVPDGADEKQDPS